MSFILNFGFIQFWHQDDLLVDSSVADGFHLQVHIPFCLRWTAGVLAGYVWIFMEFFSFVQYLFCLWILLIFLWLYDIINIKNQESSTCVSHHSMLKIRNTMECLLDILWLVLWIFDTEIETWLVNLLFYCTVYFVIWVTDCTVSRRMETHQNTLFLHNIGFSQVNWNLYICLSRRCRWVTRWGNKFYLKKKWLCMSGFMRVFGRICSCFTLLNQSVTMLLLDLESVTAKLQLLSIRHLASS